jgi:hypothetical protein
MVHLGGIDLALKGCDLRLQLQFLQRNMEKSGDGYL